ATGDDPRERAAAIAALATAPRARAVPVLQGVLNFGGDHADRELALISLRALALRQGDADGAIRNALRRAIDRHGDDEDIDRAAQAALDDIERDLRPSARKTNP